VPFFQNYGDESNSYNLLYPSIYANHGVYEADFFEPRTKEQLQAIFEGMDVKIPEEVFDELWEEAIKRNGKVRTIIVYIRSYKDQQSF